LRKKFRELEHEAFKELKIERLIRQELEVLAKEFDLHIITSNTRKNLDMYFENNNFTHIFKHILAEEEHASKTEKFRILFEKEDLNMNNCTFITDTLGDILEAKQVSVKTIAVDYGYHERERLEKGRPWKIISDFKEIRKIVNDIQD